MKIFAFFVVLMLAKTALSQSRLLSVGSISVTQRKTDVIRVDWENPEGVTYESFTVTITPRGDLQRTEFPGDTFATFTNLDPGKRYTVTIIGKTGDGRESDSVSYKVYTKPERPSNMRLNPVDEIELTVQIMGREMQFTATVVGLEIDWEGVPDTGATGYDVQVSPNEGIAISEPVDDDAIPTKAVFTGLTPGQTYDVTLRTKTGPLWDQVYSDGVEMRITLPPDVPLSAEVEEITETSAELKTHLPVVGISDGLQFEMEPNKGTIGTPRPNRIYSMFDMYTLRDLQRGTKYTVKVYATTLDKSDNKPPSTKLRGNKYLTVEFTTIPSSPVIRLYTFQEESITMRWQHPHKFIPEDDVYYIVEYVNTETNQKMQAEVRETFDINKEVEVTVYDLTPGVMYKFYVTTVVNSMRSAEPTVYVQGTMPMRPKLNLLDKDEPGKIKVNFSAPAKGLCPEINLFYSPFFMEKEIITKPLGETFELTGIPLNKRYTIHARCVSNNINGNELIIPADSQFDILTGDIIRDVPNEPTMQLPCPRLIRMESRKEVPILPNACCGEIPYNDVGRECCGATGVLIVRNGPKGCCGGDSYLKRQQKCCPNQVITPIGDECR